MNSPLPKKIGAILGGTRYPGNGKELTAKPDANGCPSISRDNLHMEKYGKKKPIIPSHRPMLPSSSQL